MSKEEKRSISVITTMSENYDFLIKMSWNIGFKNLIVVHDKINPYIENALKKIDNSFSDERVNKQFEEITNYDISQLMLKFRMLIENEYNKGNKIIVNITGGGKTLSFACLLACSREAKKIDSVFYNVFEMGDVRVEWPIPEWVLAPKKVKILKYVGKGQSNIKEIGSRIGVKYDQARNYVKSLIEDGYLVRDVNALALTETGEMMAEI